MGIKRLIKRFFRRSISKVVIIDDKSVIDDLGNDIDVVDSISVNVINIEPENKMDLRILSGQIPEKVLDELYSVVDVYKINNIMRLSHFLSQCSHESAGFKVVEENLNYSIDGLRRIFPKYFPDDMAERYARRPEMIGSRVYANRMGNGDENSKEGYRFRGRGYIQCTGKDNYGLLSKEFDVDFIKNPELISTEYALRSAGWYFNRNKILVVCDLGFTYDIVKRVTRMVNGGFNGLDDRWQKFEKFYGILSK